MHACRDSCIHGKSQPELRLAVTLSSLCLLPPPPPSLDRNMETDAEGGAEKARPGQASWDQADPALARRAFLMFFGPGELRWTESLQGRHGSKQSRCLSKIESVVTGEMSGRPPLAEKALSEGYARLRYKDTSLLIWQQQQQKLESLPPGTYLNRSRSMWYSQYGNQAILVRDKNKLDVSRDTGQSKFCIVM
ncbi:hypothetical protein JD844_004742 [Phrynosoma platyrhinos]|uniref:BRD3 opposite strand n=2 Tax=Phrynosomatinae TaxID=42425 RepID=A0ABQ7SDQ2_PHRPL|nr:hypothetical protein JD844_004742 [Phrynosoma platyrhinos]